MSAIQLVVFDMAGTTVEDDNAVLRAFEAALAAAGLDAPAVRINALMGLPKRVAIRQLLADCGVAVSDSLVESLHADFVERMKSHYAMNPEVREMPGASRAFRELRGRGIKLALNTGFGRDIVDAILQRLGWDVPGVVDAVATADDVPRGRPHPDMIRFLMALLGIADSRYVAKVGDTVADLEEGHAAGCGLNIGVLTGAATREELEQRLHTHIVATLGEAVEIISPSCGRVSSPPDSSPRP